MNIAELTDGEMGIFHADSRPYYEKDGRRIMKVAEPYYNRDERIISGFCPHCGLEVNRVWNMDYCGSCGREISWHDISVKDYGDIP